MRICVPVTSDGGISAPLYSHFGSAPYYAIVETDTGLVTTINNGNCQHQHGQCRPVDAIVGYNIDAVVCSGMGRRAFAALQGAGIDVLLSNATTVQGALAAVRDNTVRAPSPDDMCAGHEHGGHGHGGHAGG